MKGLSMVLAAGLMDTTDYSQSNVEPAEGTMMLGDIPVIITHAKLSEPASLTLNGDLYGSIVTLTCSEQPLHHLTILDEDVATQVLSQIRESDRGKELCERFNSDRRDVRAGELIRASTMAFFADNTGRGVPASEIREQLTKRFDQANPEGIVLEPKDLFVLNFGPCIVRVPAAV